MIKAIKYTKEILGVAFFSSTLLFSPILVQANHPPIIVDQVTQAPVIEGPNYNFISMVPNNNHTMHNSQAVKPTVNVPNYIVVDNEPTTQVPQFILVDHIPSNEAPELIIEDTSFNQPTPAPSNVESGVKSGVELVHWDEVREFLPMGKPLEIYDVLTGLTYNVQSLSNGAHADVETVTAADTEIFLETFGGEWSWTPRPVWVTVGDRVLAASINGQPHSVHTIEHNNMDGHVCLHFLGSTTHNGNLDFAQLHQDVLLEAWNLSK